MRLREEKQYARSYMRPTENQRMKELPLINRMSELSNGQTQLDPLAKKPVFIHDVTMGDFQLQDWRSTKMRK